MGSGTSVPDPILIVRTSSMGDIIHALPAVAALRQFLPEASLGWIVEDRFVELLCSPGASLIGPLSPGRPLVNRIHRVDTKAWRRAILSSLMWRAIAQSTRQLQAARYGVAIDFQGALRSAIFTRLSGAPLRYGFDAPREGIARLFYNRRVAASASHVVEQNYSLVKAFAGSIGTIPTAELPYDPASEENTGTYLKSQGIEKFVILNPGAGWGAKQWPAERYGEVAKKLKRFGLKCLINCGPGEEGLARAAEDASAGNGNSIQLSLTQLIAFTRRASLFIGGDTGPMHLAAALEVPVVAIFGPTDPSRNGPYRTRSIVLRSLSSVTTYKHRAQADQGLLAVTVDEVVGAAKQLLGDAG